MTHQDIPLKDHFPFLGEEGRNPTLTTSDEQTNGTLSAATRLTADWLSSVKSG